jgi:uncharacterized RDD family membrane protein YckC
MITIAYREIYFLIIFDHLIKKIINLMEQILDSPFAARSLKFAGFWIRFAAYIIDAIILGIVQAILMYAVFNGYNPMEPNYSLMIVMLVLYIVYFAGLESSGKQATIGKMAVGIKVGKEGGERISFGNAFGRYLAKIVSTITLLIGFMMAGWDTKKQALHDKIANTYVFYA